MNKLKLYFQLILLSFILTSCQDVGVTHNLTQESDQIMLDDMILDQDLIRSLDTNEDVTPQAAGGYHEYNSQTWKNGIMPVVFDPSIPKTKQDWFIQIAKKWSQGTQVSIVLRTNENDYLRVTNTEAGCFSEVGASPGRIRQLNLGPNCWTEGVALHEMGHALGLMHEHQRPDRDSYITIDFNNIDPALRYAFSVFSVSNNASAYDFQSIMHYEQFAFSTNGKITIKALPPFTKFQNIMGIKKISASDLKTIADMYAR